MTTPAAPPTRRRDAFCGLEIKSSQGGRRHRRIGAMALACLAALALGFAPAAAQVNETAVRIPHEDAPPDLSLATLALIKSLYGGEMRREEGVAFAPGEAAKLRNTGFSPDGFEPSVAFSAYGPFEDDDSQRFLSGFVHFVDAVGRRAVVEYALRYHLGEGEDHLLIEGAALSPLFSKVPRVQALIVPAALVPGVLNTASRSYRKFYLSALKNAVAVQKPGAAPRGAIDYTIFVFFFDRLSADSTIELRVGFEPDAEDGFAPRADERDFEGWRVALLKGKFALNAEQPQLMYVKAIFTPGNETGEEERTPRMVVLFPVSPYRALKNKKKVSATRSQDGAAVAQRRSFRPSIYIPGCQASECRLIATGWCFGLATPERFSEAGAAATFFPSSGEFSKRWRERPMSRRTNQRNRKERSMIRMLRLLLPALIGAAMMSTTADATDPENALYMDLKDGRVIIEMRPDLAPKHVARIKELVRSGFYDELTFHRVIAGFMAQTGDPRGNGTGGSGVNLPAEFSDEEHVRGTLSMARAANPDSADSQFFIVFAPSPFLDGNYTVWGKVVSGIEFVDHIKKGTGRNGKVFDPDRILRLQVVADADQ